jgi:DNA mismatch endonuclease (patch repair protein)
MMARIRGTDTGPERMMAAALADHGLSAERHARDLPGRPDFVFRDARVAVFVDGDFWHGRHFANWRHKLSEKWERKIAMTRLRDARNVRALRRAGWKVVRIWEHDLGKGVNASTARVVAAVRARSAALPAPQP